jgi:hypothetical protein
MSDFRQQHGPWDVDDLRRLAHTQPLVRDALVMYEHGASFQQVLLGLVLALSEQLDNAQDALYKQAVEAHPAYLVTVGPDGRQSVRVYNETT